MIRRIAQSYESREFTEGLGRVSTSCYGVGFTGRVGIGASVITVGWGWCSLVAAAIRPLQGTDSVDRSDKGVDSRSHFGGDLRTKTVSGIVCALAAPEAGATNVVIARTLATRWYLPFAGDET